MPILEQFIHAGRRTLHPLLRPVVRIGRDASNDLSLGDPLVSRFHCRLFRRGEEFAIEDLGSRNGTFVDGVRRREARVLTDGQVIRIGRSTFTYRAAVALSSLSLTEYPRAEKDDRPLTKGPPRRQRQRTARSYRFWWRFDIGQLAFGWRVLRDDRVEGRYQGLER